MTDSIDRRFNRVADGYAACRPTCPPELADAVASMCHRHDSAWEPGCGSGQVTAVLAPHFKTVLATDPAESAIERAPVIKDVRFAVGDASSADLAAGSVDLIASGQAAHWFDMDRFASEARRVGTAACVIALWCYDRPRVSDDIDRVIDHLYFEVLRGCWAAGRAHIDTRYADLTFPFAEFSVPTPDYAATWTAADMLGYLRTWSAVDAHQQFGRGDAVSVVEQPLTRAWGHTERAVRWPVGMRIGRVDG